MRLAVGGGGHPQYDRTRVVDLRLPWQCSAAAGRPAVPLLAGRRRGGAARAGGVRDDARLRGRRSGSTCTCAGSPSRRACSSCPRPTRRRSEGFVGEALASLDRPDAVLRVVWTPGAGGDGSIGFVLVTPLPRASMTAGPRDRAGVAPACHRRGDPPRVAMAPAGVKSTSYAVNMAAQAEAAGAARTTPFFLCSRASARVPDVEHLVRRGRCPAHAGLELGILAGVTRETLIAAAGRPASASSRASTPRTARGRGRGLHLVERPRGDARRPPRRRQIGDGGPGPGRGSDAVALRRAVSQILRARPGHLVPGGDVLALKRVRGGPPQATRTMSGAFGTLRGNMPASNGRRSPLRWSHR